MQQWLNPTPCPLNPCWQQTSELGLHCLQNQWRKWCWPQMWLLGAQGISEGTAPALEPGAPFPQPASAPGTGCPKLCRDNLQAGPWQTQPGKSRSPSDWKKLSPHLPCLTAALSTGKQEGRENTLGLFTGNLLRSEDDRGSVEDHSYFKELGQCVFREWQTQEMKVMGLHTALLGGSSRHHTKAARWFCPVLTSTAQPAHPLGVLGQNPVPSTWSSRPKSSPSIWCSGPKSGPSTWCSLPKSSPTHLVFSAILQSIHLVFRAKIQTLHLVFSAKIWFLHLVFSAKIQSLHLVFWAKIGLFPCKWTAGGSNCIQKAGHSNLRHPLPSHKEQRESGSRNKKALKVLSFIDF